MAKPRRNLSIFRLGALDFTRPFILWLSVPLDWNGRFLSGRLFIWWILSRLILVWGISGGRCRCRRVLFRWPLLSPPLLTRGNLNSEGRSPPPLLPPRHFPSSPPPFSPA